MSGASERTNGGASGPVLSASIFQSFDLLCSGPTAESAYAKEALKAHTAARMERKASNMMHLTWDQALAGTLKICRFKKEEKSKKPNLVILLSPCLHSTFEKTSRTEFGQ